MQPLIPSEVAISFLLNANPDSLLALVFGLIAPFSYIEGLPLTVCSPFQHDDYMFSRVLTLDLSQYPDTEGEEGSRRQRESR